MKTGSHASRLIFIGVCIAVLFFVLLGRAIDLTVLDRSFLKGQGDARVIRTIPIPAYRGMIADREGVPLAISTPVHSVWINPTEFSPDISSLQKLSALIGVEPALIQSKQVNKHREFVYLKRQLSPFLMDQIKQLNIPGLYFQQEFKRYYPEGSSIAQLIGFTNIDDNGLEGLELAYHNWLVGVPGKRRVVIDPAGHLVDDLGVKREPRPGNDLILSVDRRIQYLAYHALKETLAKFKAKSGSVVVLDVLSGELLAVANAPSYNPNVRTHYVLNRYRNKALTDLFEPGSVMKAFSIASALQGNQFNPKTIIDTRPGYMLVEKKLVRDIHNYGVLDVTGVLQHSSNVGVTKMLLQFPPEQLIGLLRRAGFGDSTETGYPGESAGSVLSVREAKPFALATLGFGYGLSVTAVQLARAYSIFANQGMLKPITLIHQQQTGAPVQVMAPEIAKQVLMMMETVLDNVKAARVPGYRVAGKTGTARIASMHGYDKNRHIGSFIGIAPVSNPRIVVVAVVHEPTQGGYYGAVIAAPLFSQVASGALRILNVPPDQNIAAGH